MSVKLPIDSCVSLINSGDDCLTKNKYRVPAYQRPYSWGEEQIDDFLKTIIDGFNEDASKFFGTMQFVDGGNDYEVVDGQQRLTTMRLFLYVLNGLAENASFVFDFDIDFSNMKTANNLIKDLFAQDINKVKEIKRVKDKPDNRDIANIFEGNIRLLKEKLIKSVKDDPKGRDKKQYAKDLIDYFGNNVYVVVLKTDKDLPLPEVVSIFNTINTTGMDLNTEDIFKFQYYEYLRNKEKCPASIANEDYWINKINECYSKIEMFNEGKPIKNHISMSNVLSIYQHSICAKYEDDFRVLAKSSERFFADIFANPAKYAPTLKFSEFERLVDLFISFYKELDENKYNDNPLYSLSLELIKQTRYPRYWTFPYVYVYIKGDSDSIRKDALKNTYHLFSYLIVQSINFQRSINPVHTFICKEILPAILKNNDITSMLKSKQWCDPYDASKTDSGKTEFLDNLKQNALKSSKANTICLLLALYYEKKTDLKSLKEKFFNWDSSAYDIEHIYSHDSFSEDPTFSDDDKSYFNGIGNLIVLEQKINRDLGRKRILLPSDKYKKRNDYYEKSKYKIVKDFVPMLEKWDLDKVKKRSAEQQNTLTTEILNMDKN